MNVDYYWHLDAAESFDVHKDVPTPSIGQVSDDVASVHKFATGEDGDAAWHVLQHLIGVLKALSDC